MNKIPSLLVGALLLTSGCAEAPAEKGKPENTATADVVQWAPPAPGNVVDQLEKRIEEDKLNKKYFRVSVWSNAESVKGQYTLKLEYGFNINERDIQLPQWPGKVILRPVIKEGPDKYHCYIGFEAGDNQFHELYEVKVTNGNISLKQTHRYYL